MEGHAAQRHGIPASHHEWGEGRFVPFGEWIIVKVDPLPSTFETGLYIPGGGVNAWRKYDWTAFGVVLAIGTGERSPRDGVRHANYDFAVGDRVLWQYRPSNEKEWMARVCGDRTMLLRADEIVGVVEDAEGVQLRGTI